MLRLSGAVVLLAASASASFAAEPERGRILYELRCGTCHTQSVHGRARRAALDFVDVRRWVARWNENLRLGWDNEEIDDVAVYLNDTFYRYACPPDVCKVVSLRSRTGSPGAPAD